ncbi:MAG: endonuclease [Chitinophagaceae bacterium]|nr:endonuclease [Chitinophagaceae bacterium]
MNAQNNPSLNVNFITSKDDQKRQHNKFGTLSSFPGLAFNPETTGANILAEAMVQRHVADERDLEAFVPDTDIADAPPPPGIPDLSEVAAGEDDNEWINYERVIDLPDFLPSWFFDVGCKRASAVCKIEVTGVDYKGRSGTWYGTGFLIGSNILLTNHHILNSREVAKNAICIFNYQTDSYGKVLPTDTYMLQPDKLFITSQASGGLDFTACLIESAATQKYGYVPIFRHAFGIKNDDCANIVQHPDGQHKAIVVQKNEVYSQTDITVLYTSDTMPGSSGAFVCNNAWKLVALHHASRKIREADLPTNKKAVYLNEGIKMAAIATYLEGLSDRDENYGAARKVLDTFNGVDSAMGYFGSLGRQNSVAGAGDLELVTTSYKGEEKDIDICFWNIEWFNKHYKQKIKDVAWEISVQNLDIWVLSESSPQAADALVVYLKKHYNLDFATLASEPDALSSKQTTTVLWNTKTVDIEKIDWPERVERWLQLDSSNFSNLQELQDELELEKVDGKIFDRYPGLFKVTARLRENAGVKPFDFMLIPLHLKAMAEGSKRRRFACRILAEAMKHCLEHEDFDADWVLGGDLNATIVSGDLEELTGGGLVAMSASDAEEQAFSYLKRPFRSLIDHVYLSPSLTDRTDKDGFMILARERDTTRDGNSNGDYLTISDHRPIMIRLSINNELDTEKGETQGNDDHVIEDILGVVGDKFIKSIPGVKGGSKTKGNDISEISLSKEEALQLLEENKKRVYFNEEEDKVAKRAYYGKMPGALNAKQLFNHFQGLVKETHTSLLSYKPAVYVYPWVDLQQDLTLVNLYSGEATEPESLIEADFEIDEQDLESRGMYNCEHVVPQSWFSKSNPQRGDLHHLFACTPGCNSFRGNIPYKEFPDWEEKVMDNCGNREGDGFEPKRAKGVVARATLYFMLRYPEVQVPYKGVSLNDLLAWNLEEPPTIYEFHRNAAIQELQGNRNPFIDFTKLATKLDFGR